MAAGKARGIARSIARSTKYLRATDRAGLIRALAHPHLDYCQEALAEPSAIALNSTTRAYNFTARIATNRHRSEPARGILGWPEWQERGEREKGSTCFENMGRRGTRVFTVASTGR